MALLRSLRYDATLILQNRIYFVGLFCTSLLVFVGLDVFPAAIDMIRYKFV